MDRRTSGATARGIDDSLSVALAAGVSSWWLVLTAFVAVNLLLFAAVGWCPASLLMHRLGLQRRADLR